MSDTNHSDAFKRARREAIAKYIFAGAVIALLVGVLVQNTRTSNHVDSVVTAIRQEQVQNTVRNKRTNQAAVSSGQVLHILKDCLTPGGVCYQQNSANTQAVLGELTTIFKRISEYVATCEREPTVGHSTAALQSCVDTLQKENGNATGN